ncbi:OsmC family protein [Agromyces sp. Marseille-P2726]|uniref:OsmC family protein n=1 Tax=Agromyces sp. Marseille-P2726 TaxID=2709132 RepID=UPI0020C4B52C|nr:OsmC family protein [Agromyces sp. Marseille-P2726]
MTTTDEPTAEHAHQVSDRLGPGSVSVTRVGPRMYEGLNERGATLRVGGPELEGVHFTPGELLKLALISCSGLSADRVAARRLGDDFALTVWAHGHSERETNRYHRIDEEFLLDLSSLDPAERDQLIAIMEKAIRRGCTVARTIEGVVELPTTIDGDEV